MPENDLPKYNILSKNRKLDDYNTYNDIKKLMRILSYMIDFLEKELSSGKLSSGKLSSGEDIAEIGSIFGSKENAVSAITKLSQIFLKLYPLNEEIQHKKNTTIERDLSLDDKKIIEEFITNYNKKHFSARFKK